MVLTGVVGGCGGSRGGRCPSLADYVTGSRRGIGRPPPDGVDVDYPPDVL